MTRLFVSPLLAAFTRLIGDDPYIRYLSSFRYPLSGEFAVQRDLALRMRLPSDWGLEIVSLFEALRHRAPVRVCQVEIAERYDHKHQDLSRDDPDRGLNRMARDVGTHLLRTLAAAGVVLAPGVLESLLAAYQREAEDAVADSYAVAALKGLLYDRHQEELSVQTFSNCAAKRHRGVPLRSPWTSTRAELGEGLGWPARGRPPIAGRGRRGTRRAADGRAVARWFLVRGRRSRLGTGAPRCHRRRPARGYAGLPRAGIPIRVESRPDGAEASWRLIYGRHAPCWLRRQHRPAHTEP